MCGNEWKGIGRKKVRSGCKVSKIVGHDARSDLPSGVCNLFTWGKLYTLHTSQGSDEVNVRVYIHSFFDIDVNPLALKMDI